MFPRRVTRSATRTAAATAANHLPAAHPAAPVAANDPPAARAAAVPVSAPQPPQTTNEPSLRTRSGRVVRKIASTVQKLAGGRRNRKAAEQELVESGASTSAAPARPTTNAPPPRKRARKNVPAASTSSNAAPVEAPVTTTSVATSRKRAGPKKQPVAVKARGRSAKGKAPASLPVSEPEPEPAEKALADVPPKAVEDYDALTSSISELNRTILANGRILRGPEPPYKSALGIPKYKYLGTTFNFFNPAFRLACGNRPFSTGVQEQPAPIGGDYGYETESESDDESAVGNDEGASSQAEASQPQSSTQSGMDVDDLDYIDVDDLNYDPIVFPAIPEPREEVPMQHPIPGAAFITRQNAYIFDSNGEPLPTGRGEPDYVPAPIGDEVAALLKSWRGPLPYPENWHGPMFEQELQPATPSHDAQPRPLTRQYAVNLEYPEGNTSSAKRPRCAPLTRQYAVNLGYPKHASTSKPGPSSRPQASDHTRTMSTHQHGSQTARERYIPGILNFRDMYMTELDGTSGASTSTPVQVVGTPSQSPNVPAAEDPEAAGPSTVPRRNKLKREYTVFIDKDGREISVRAEDDSSNDGPLVPIGLLAFNALQQMDTHKGAGPSQARSQERRRSITPACAASSSRLAALSRTSSQNSLGLLTSSGKGKGVAFSRQGSQAPLGSNVPSSSQQTPLSSVGESAEPARVDKGKGRALPEPEPAREDAPVDKGKKRAREDEPEEEGSSESSDGDLDEVEASLVVDLTGEEDEEEEDLDLSDWPRNYVVRKSLFRVEVSMVPMPYLPIAPLPKDGELVLQYVGPRGIEPPTILATGSKRARDEDEVAEEGGSQVKRARTTSE